MKKGYASLTAAVLLTMIGGFFKFGLAGYGFGAYVLWGAAGVCGAFWVLGRLRERWPRVCGVVSKILTYGVMIGCFLVLSTLAVVVAGGQAENDAGAQYAIVLGAGVNGTVPSLSLATRLEAALRYAGENPETVLILSGGQGSGERITEARCMYDWLTARGIPAERLLLEERASNTRENVGFSREIIEARE
ncbi:MAG: YdcF family protein, partial [bacterium]